MDSLSAAIAHLLDGGGVVGALPSAVNVLVGLSAGRYSHVPGCSISPEWVIGLVRNR
jgi:hypothetical protein